MIPFILYRSLWWLHEALRFIGNRIRLIAFALLILIVLVGSRL